MRKTKLHKIKLYRRDLENFELQAKQGKIPTELAQASAIVVSAMRELQVAAGGGHVPLDVLFDTLPPAYQANWLLKKHSQMFA